MSKMFHEDEVEGKGFISEYIFQDLTNNTCTNSGPLGLKLTVSQSFLSLLESRLSTDRNNHNLDVNKFDKSIMCDSGSLSMLDKLKASNFPMASIVIGQWQRYSRHEGELTAKIYYAKKKIVWEILDGGLKSKMEILWSQISAIRVTILHHQHAFLDIQLEEPPLFYCEANPQPRKHTVWNHTHDFTGGHASCFRNHCITFPPGVFDKYYEKLLQCDPRLFKLSLKPFPISESPYFNSFNPQSVIDDRTINFQAASNINGTQGSLGHMYGTNYGYQPSTMSIADIENHLLGESPIVPSENGILQAQVEMVSSLLEQDNHGQNQEAETLNNNLFLYDDFDNLPNVDWVDDSAMIGPTVDNNLNSFLLPYDARVEDPFSTAYNLANPWK